MSHSPGSHPLEIGDPLGFVDGCTDTAFVQDSCDFRPMVKAVAATAGAIARDLTGVATAASA